MLSTEKEFERSIAIGVVLKRDDEKLYDLVGCGKKRDSYSYMGVGT